MTPNIRGSTNTAAQAANQATAKTKAPPIDQKRHHLSPANIDEGRHGVHTS